MPTLTVKRESGWVDALRNYRILVDEISISKIGNGETIQFEIGKNTHSIQARIDWCGSRTINFDGTSDQTVFVKSGIKGWRVFLFLYYIIFDRLSYLELELAD